MIASSWKYEWITTTVEKTECWVFGKRRTVDRLDGIVGMESVELAIVVVTSTGYTVVIVDPDGMDHIELIGQWEHLEGAMAWVERKYEEH